MIPFRDFVDNLEEEDFLRLKSFIDLRYKEDFADLENLQNEKEEEFQDNFFEIMGAIIARFFSGLKELFHLLTS